MEEIAPAPFSSRTAVTLRGHEDYSNNCTAAAKGLYRRPRRYPDGTMGRVCSHWSFMGTLTRLFRTRLFYNNIKQYPRSPYIYIILWYVLYTRVSRLCILYHRVSRLMFLKIFFLHNFKYNTNKIMLNRLYFFIFIVFF